MYTCRLGLACVAILALLLTTQGAAQDDDQQKPVVWKWVDFEVMGHHSVSREEIIKHVPHGEYRRA